MAAFGSPPTPDAALDWAAPYRVDLRAVLGPFGRGSVDPTMRLPADGSAWVAARTPDGAATLRLAVAGSEVEARAWGPGAGWLVGSVPDLLGARDDPTGFPAHLLPTRLREVWDRLAPRWRVPRSGRVVEALVIAVLEQKVTGVQSRRSWRALLEARGAPAPGPAPVGMRVLPSAQEIRSVPSWQWHRWGVAPHQSSTVMAGLRSPGRIEECAALPPDGGRARLLSVPGIGPWTAAEVAQRSMGDADAVSVGDYHLARHVVFAFSGAMDGTDEQMLDLLEPFAGHRYRVQRLVEVSGIARPARGPRMTIADHRRR